MSRHVACHDYRGIPSTENEFVLLCCSTGQPQCNMLSLHRATTWWSSSREDITVIQLVLGELVWNNWNTNDLLCENIAWSIQACTRDHWWDRIHQSHLLEGTVLRMVIVNIYFIISFRSSNPSVPKVPRVPPPVSAPPLPVSAQRNPSVYPMYAIIWE